MLHGNATWLLTKSPEFADEHDLVKFVSEAYGSVAIGLLVLCCVPLSLSLVGSYLQDHADAWRPHWMKESWANTSDAYRLLLQEIYGGRRARIGRVLVGTRHRHAGSGVNYDRPAFMWFRSSKAPTGAICA